MKKDLNCKEKEFITCPTCSMNVDKKYLGERCPRCNAIILPQGCKGCKNSCK